LWIVDWPNWICSQFIFNFSIQLGPKGKVSRYFFVFSTALVLSFVFVLGIYLMKILFCLNSGGGAVFRIRSLYLLMLGIIGFSTSVFASGGIINWYEEGYRLVAGEGFDAHLLDKVIPICGGVFTLAVCAIVGLIYSRKVASLGADVTPDDKFSLRTVVELAMDLVYGISRDNLAEKWRTFIPLLAGIFMFIVVSNLGGLVPGFIPATEHLNTNLAMGITIFLVYNIAGFREHGVHYLQQFAGPMLAIAPLMLTIEIVSHLFRPVSLSLRLMGNIFADHLMLGIFTSTAPHILIPSALLFFGLLVSLVQSFVFTLLSSIYISLAVSHDH
jgi:F-type H+-transporting ATPase subunit a